METIQLIRMLFDSMDSEYIQNNDDKIIDLLEQAATSLENLTVENKQLRTDLIMQTALAQNKQNVTEVNKQLTIKFDALLKDFKEVVIESEDVCKYCKNYQPCEGKNCKDYIEGKDAWDYKSCYHDWVWSCQDFDYGKRPKLENTSCNGCNFKNNFEWKGF